MTQKTTLIQGAARGLGLALVQRVLADSDDQVLATARDPDHAKDLQALGGRYGGNRLHLLALDVADESSIERARQQAGEHAERLERVIICAGLLHDEAADMWPEKQLADIRPDNLAKSFVVNASGPLLVIKHFHDLLTHGKRAVIASISARVGSISDNGFGGWYAYRASKAAQNQFTRTAAIELKRKSKQLICVGLHPGTVDTGLSEPFQKRVPNKQLQTPDTAAGHLLDVLAELSPEDSGQLFDWAGERIEP